MDNVFGYYVDLPAKTYGVTLVKGDDIIIFINKNICPAKQKDALRHELEHVNKGHLYNDIKLVAVCEAEAS